MVFEMLVGLNVVDGETYQTYRDAMTPILERYGGGFGYDFQVSEVLRARTEAPINRVFTIYFANEESRDMFFSNTEYLEVKRKFFEGAVTDTTLLASYER